MNCNVCPRKCNVDRRKILGICQEGNEIRIAKIINNFKWEEPPISRKNGTCAIFFSGCNLKCSFCQNYKISRGSVGKLYTLEEFVELLKKIDLSDNETIDLITPTHFTEQLIEAFKIYKPKKRIIWNSSGYENVESIEKLAAYIDIFLPDFKYCSPALSFQYSKAKDYFEVASKAIKKMSELKPNKFKDGELIQGVIIRHLVLPEHAKDSFKIFDFIKENIQDPIISVMSQFVPSGENKEGRKLSIIEYKAVLSHINKLGLSKGYFQELSSSNENYIPDF